MPIDPSDSVFNVDEAAEFARVSPDKIRAWFDEGLRHMRTAANSSRTGPRMAIVRKLALLEFIEAREVGAREADVVPQPGEAPTRRGRPSPALNDPFNLMKKRGRSDR